MEKTLVESGADILYDSSICGIYMEDNKAVGVKVFTPNGFRNFSASVLIDSTADAHTAHMAGCKTEYGRKTDGLTQPYTMVSFVQQGDFFRSTNHDFGRVDQRDFQKRLYFPGLLKWKMNEKMSDLYAISRLWAYEKEEE